MLEDILMMYSSWDMLHDRQMDGQMDGSDIKRWVPHLKAPKSNKHFSNYLKNQNLNSFLLDAVTENEVYNIIESTIGNLNSRKAVELNSIPTCILKECENVYTKSSIINNYESLMKKWTNV